MTRFLQVRSILLGLAFAPAWSGFVGCVPAASNPPRPSDPAAWVAPERKSAAPRGVANVEARADDAPVATALPTTSPGAPAASSTSAAAPSSPASPPIAAAETNSGAQAPISGATEDSEPIVARVAGRPIYAAELVAQWMYLDPLQVKELLDNLVLARLFVAEAARLNLALDADRRAQAYEQAVKALEDQIGKKRPGMNLDRYVDRVLGLDPIRYRERLRDDAVRQLVGERVMRAWLLSTEHAEIRAIVVKSEEDLKAVQDELAAGAAFEAVATKRSIDEISAREGGRMTPIVKSDTTLGRLAFETAVGAVSAPKFDNGAWLIAKVEARPAPLVGDWSAVGPAVEKSLLDRPVDGLEAKQWNYAMLSRYAVDEKPFMDFVSRAGK